MNLNVEDLKDYLGEKAVNELMLRSRIRELEKREAELKERIKELEK